MTADLWKSLWGGMLIGAGAAVLLLLKRKIAGISGIAENAVRGLFGEKGWRIGFLVGLVIPAALFGLGPIEFAQGLPILALSGFLVGFGTRLGSGCTSGHGVCGLANFSPFDPQRVLAFLDFAGQWNPALAFTMFGAILVAAPAFFYVRGRRVDLLGAVTELPDRLKIDRRLVVGSTIFGIGWGLSGICPGPALLLLTAGSIQSIVFAGAVIAGFLALRFLPKIDA